MIEIHSKIVESRQDSLNYYYKVLEIFEDYFKNEDNKYNFEYLKLIGNKTNCNTDLYCNKCNAYKIFNSEYYVCPNCGECGETEFFNYSRDIKNYQPYRRINHLIKKLDEIKMRKYEIDPTIKNELIKYKIKSPEQVKKILKKLKMKNQYKYCVHIFVTHCEYKINSLTKNEESMIKDYFVKIVNIFKSNNNFGRKNFLNYYFVLNEILKLINREDICIIIPKLLNKSKLKNHFKIWNKIIAYFII